MSDFCLFMQTVKNTIPVYDIYAVKNEVQLHEDVVVEPFAAYLKTRGHLFTPHRHSFYHIVLFTSGSGTHTIDFEQFDIRAGQIYFMAPGQVHNWNFTSEPDGYVVNFSDSLFRSFITNPSYLEQFPFLRAAAKDSVIDLKADTLLTVIQYFKSLVKEVKDNDAFCTDMVCFLLASIFITVSRDNVVLNKKTAPGQNQLVLYNFRKLVNEYYAEKKLPRDYAAMLYITPNHINALCTDLLGMSAGEVIRDRILLEAKRLLVNAGTSISEIAYQLNFSDNSYFAKFFKKYTGTTPEDFRRSFRIEKER